MRLTSLSFALTLFFVSVSARYEVPTSFVLVGDSTTANGTIPDSGGWGNGFCGSTNVTAETPSSLRNGTVCVNTAKNGATTGSFVADGSWNISLAAVEAEIAKGRRTLVTIQFGHNDMKIAPPESMGANITIMVNQLRALGAEPVLVTSLTRRTFFDNGTIQDLLAPWADETITIGQQLGTHLLDLHANSIAYCEAIGSGFLESTSPSGSKSFRLPDDNTHLNLNGTIVFGRMLANLMDASFPRQLPIIPNPQLT
ncbi:SGNH hydrolase [Mycena filopes]|nr:SGNH hydrolase [Mycena filopes]